MVEWCPRCYEGWNEGEQWPHFSALIVAVAAVAAAQSAIAQTAAERREQARADGSQAPGLPRRARAREPHKQRPAPPFDLTGTWFVDLSRGFAIPFRPALSRVHRPGEGRLREGQRCKAAQPYRDAIGQCFPAGIPMIMTRVWPITMVQLPTVIFMVSTSTTSFRQIFLDGRHSDDPNT